MELPSVGYLNGGTAGFIIVNVDAPFLERFQKGGVHALKKCRRELTQVLVLVGLRIQSFPVQCHTLSVYDRLVNCFRNALVDLAGIAYTGEVNIDLFQGSGGRCQDVFLAEIIFHFVSSYILIMF